MYISAFLHRDQLFEVTNRWLSSRLSPDDPLLITRIINYDGFVAWETLQDFIPGLLTHLGAVPYSIRDISRKKHLKDYICNGYNKDNGSSRIRDLISQYRGMPEFFYIGSPVAGKLFHDPDNRIRCICRFKRVKRIAEKANRYVSTFVFDGVKNTAETILRERNMPLPGPVRFPPEIISEAEKRVMKKIRDEGIHLPVQAMTLKDVLGMKIVDTGFGAAGIESAIDHMDNATIVEKEIHTGAYNAVHYVVELRVDFKSICKDFPERADKAALVRRGLPGDHLEEDFQAFLKTGVDSVQVDLILTTFEELVESEIGRSMHESRIFKQREHYSFYGNIPNNIEYILEYMLAVGLSPATEVKDIPIKIWGRYLPDTLSHHIRLLYGMPEPTLVSP
jgi:hypothetical protein